MSEPINIPMPWDDEEPIFQIESPDHPDPAPPIEDIVIPHFEEADAAEPIEDTSKFMWQQMEKYHEMGLSMMWGRAEDEPAKGKKAKSPLVSTWNSEVEGRFTLDALSKAMVKAGATVRIAPIIICGKGSGHLIVIDIDVKHMPGIDAKFFLAIQQTYPELWPRLRIHKTPSGGYHILYRTFEHVHFTSKNPGLAYAPDKREAGIESRTHGGYVLAPPGFGYSVFQDVPIPTITVEEHEQLFALARLFNEKITIKKARAVKAYEEIYDENPFDHFDASPAAEQILTLNGWTFDYENSQFAHYTRPGKGGGVSASFHKEKRFYHFFTTSSEFDNDHFNGNYSPVAVKCLLEANNDWKKLYLILKNEGYGKHKPGYEAKMVRKAVETGRELPANFSEEAKAQLEVAVEEKNTKYPHGIFWEYNPSNNTYSIQRELLRRFMHNIGLRLHKKAPVIIEGQFIRKLKETKKENGESDVYDIIRSWIREEEEEVYLSLCHEFDKFWQASGEFTVTKLSKLDTSLVLKSNAKIVYKVFLNGILTISSELVEMRPTSDMGPKLIWSDSVIQHEFRYVDKEQQRKSMFVDFLHKAMASDIDYVQLVIGYLVCGYKAVDESYFIILQEPRHSSKGGGSGKGFWFKMLSPMISVLVINAESIKKDIDQLLQSWDGQQAIHLSDFPKWVNLSSLKNIITDDIQNKILYKNILNLLYEDTPKLVGSSQFGIDTKSDGGVGGRVREVAFTDYFGRNYNKISDEYGGQCPDVWDSEERAECQDWAGYFSYMADAIKLWLGKRSVPLVEDEGLWEKGFDLRYKGGDGYLREAIGDQVKEWSRIQQVSVTMVMDWYKGLCDRYEVGSRDRIGIDTLQRAIKEYGEVVGNFEYRYGESMGVERENIDGVRARVVKIKMLEKEDGWDDVQVIPEEKEGERDWGDPPF